MMVIEVYNAHGNSILRREGNGKWITTEYTIRGSIMTLKTSEGDQVTFIRDPHDDILIRTVYDG